MDSNSVMQPTFKDKAEGEGSYASLNTASTALVCTIASSVSTLAVSEDKNESYRASKPDQCDARQDQCPRKKKRLYENSENALGSSTSAFKCHPITHSCRTEACVEGHTSGCQPLGNFTMKRTEENHLDCSAQSASSIYRVQAPFPVRPFTMEREKCSWERKSCFRVEAIASKMLGESSMHFHLLSDNLASSPHQQRPSKLMSLDSLTSKDPTLTVGTAQPLETSAERTSSRTAVLKQNQPRKRRRCKIRKKDEKNEKKSLDVGKNLSSVIYDCGRDEDWKIFLASEDSSSSSSCDDDDDCNHPRKWYYRRFTHKEPHTLKLAAACLPSINDLPSNILMHIFLWLPLATRLSVIRRVCKKWQAVVGDPSLWRELDLRGLPRLKDSTLVQLTSLSNRVHLLDMSDGKSTLVTDSGIQKVLKQCSFLKTVKMSRSFYLSDESFASLGRYCKNLKSISLDGCFTLTDTALKEISKGCHNLQELNISQCSKVSDEGVCSVARGCPKLTKFRLDQCVKVTDAGVMALAEHCTNLECLHMLSCSLTDVGIIQLKKLQKLRVLDLSNVTQLGPRCLETVAVNCPRLETLCISLNRAIDDKCVRTIAEGCPLLRSLSCVACRLTDAGLQHLGKYARKLERLDVAWCSDITDTGIVAISETSSSLHYLGFMRCGQVTMETIEGLLQRYPHIQYSNFVLESRKLLQRAEQAGLLCQPDDEQY